jgi:hypothetical protein
MLLSRSQGFTQPLVVLGLRPAVKSSLRDEGISVRPGRRIMICAALLTAVTLVTAAVTASVYKPPVAHAMIRAAVEQTVIVTPDGRADLASVKAAARPAASLDASFTYRIQRGDTLSKIAKKLYGHARFWPVIYKANHVRWADRIKTGHTLTIVPLPRHIPAAPAELAPPPPPAPVVHLAAASAPAAAPAAPAVQPVTSQQVSVGGGGFEACVIRAESGGNPVAQNPTSTASGLFGFLSTTWTAITGLPGPARDYSVATQEAAFQKEYAESGTSPWAPYDGC